MNKSSIGCECAPVSITTHSFTDTAKASRTPESILETWSLDTLADNELAVNSLVLKAWSDDSDDQSAKLPRVALQLNVNPAFKTPDWVATFRLVDGSTRHFYANYTLDPRHGVALGSDACFAQLNALFKIFESDGLKLESIQTWKDSTTKQ